MDDSRVQDEFDRMRHHQDRDKAWEIISQYEQGLAQYRTKVLKHAYEIGKLDERLGAMS